MASLSVMNFLTEIETELDIYFWVFLPEPRTPTRVVGHAAIAEYVRLDRWHWEAVG